MYIYEYQAKRLLSRCGMAAPEGAAASSVGEALSVYRRTLKKGRCAVKAQNLCPAKGEAGAMQFASGPRQLKIVARQIFARGAKRAEGEVARKILIEEALTPAKRFYLSMMYDCDTGFPFLVASPMADGGGGRVRKHVIKEKVNPFTGLFPYQLRRIAYGFGLKEEMLSEAGLYLSAFVKAFFDLDLSLLEINPLGLVRGKGLVAIGCRMSIDDRGLFRHPELANLRERRGRSRLEAEAKEAGLTYIPADADIACLANGTGLAMATMDAIKSHGGRRAGFLDVGSVADVEKIKQGLKILLSDRKTKAVLINIFCGTAKADAIAQGIIEVAKKVKMKLPVVVRLEGANVESGRNSLSRSRFNFITAPNIEDAAAKAVEAAAKRMREESRRR